MGVGIGIGIGISLKMNGLKLVVAGVIGGIASGFTLMFDGSWLTGLQANEPVKTYLVTIFGILFIDKVLIRKNPLLIFYSTHWSCYRNHINISYWWTCTLFNYLYSRFYYMDF